MRPYLDSWSYQQDAERYALMLLHRYVLRRRARGLTHASPMDAIHRMDEVQLARFFEQSGEDVMAANSLSGSVAALRRRIAERLEATAAVDEPLPVDRIARRFSLNPMATQLLQVLATCHASAHVGELVGLVTGSRYLPWPRGKSLAELIALNDDEHRAVLTALGDSEPLSRFRLLTQGPRPEGWNPAEPVPVGLRSYVLAQRVADALEDRLDTVAPRLSSCAHLDDNPPGFAELELDMEQRDALASIIPPQGAADAHDTPRSVWFIGPRGSEVKPLMGAIARHNGATLMRVDVDLWLKEQRANGAEIGELLREVVLARRTLALDFSGLSEHALMEREPQVALLRLIRAAEEAAETFGFDVYLHTHRPLKFLRLHCSHIEPFEVGFPQPRRRQNLWRAELDKQGLTLEEDDLRRLSHAFVFTRADIARICETVRRAPAGLAGEVDPAHLQEVCRNDMDIRLQGLTRRIHRPWTLDDIVLSPHQQESVEEIIAYARHRQDLVEVWGLSRYFVTGIGVNCLFSGPPGTGKTMAASVIANALDLPLYRIELSQVVDRYVGETEKRLQQIFDEASRCPCALLFDEADSLFGKRTEVRSSNDRYANLEVNYLLQRMEEFAGVTFLTTNLAASLDDAFIRRIQFQVEFPEPDRELAHHLWKNLIPDEIELGDDVDFDLLAEHFELSGGHIKNVVIRATLKAMRQSRDYLTQDDLQRASLVEYAKLGRLTPQEFLEDAL